jgi:hypothetical protein
MCTKISSHLIANAEHVARRPNGDGVLQNNSSLFWESYGTHKFGDKEILIISLQHLYRPSRFKGLNNTCILAVSGCGGQALNICFAGLL